MYLALALITGAVLVGALVFCALALRPRGRRVVVGAQGASGPLPPWQGDPPAALARPGDAVAAVEPAPPAAVSGLSKAEAEALLDWLEAQGYRGCEVSYDEQTLFTVRCR